MTPESPYKGLMPYDRYDRENFFGRDLERELLISQILTHKLTLLYAATGVGKSSLLRAAVIPELEDLNKDNLDVAYHRAWIDLPIDAIRDSVTRTLCDRHKITEHEAHQLNEGSLPEFFDRCAAYCSEPLVLILDQFEEFFRYHRRQPDFFSWVDQLAEVMTDRKLPVIVVLSMREDFLAELSVFRGRAPELFSNYYRLHKLTWRQAREAIVKPVEQDGLGFQYEEGLLDALLRDLTGQESAEAGRPDREPYALTAIEGAYLQIVCQELWRREQNNPKRFIRQSAYDALGGANAVVKSYFERIISDCTPAERRLASRAFALLVTEWGAKMAYPERVLAQLLKVKLPRLHPVLEKLKAARILRDEQRPEGVWYELYHDVFANIIDGWRKAVRQRQRRRLKASLAGLVLGLAGMLGIAGYQGYQLSRHQARLAQNAGLLQVRQAVGATRILTCIRYYDAARACPAEPILMQGTSIALPGPADYALTARAADWLVKHPVYIDGVTHQIAVTVRPPPRRIPAGMAYIPGGIFRMGDKDLRDVKGLQNERPAHDVDVTGFYLDVYEVTNARYQQCVKAGACTHAHYDDGACYHPMAGEIDARFREASKPVACVDWQQAKTFCEYRGKRLPTEAEWEKAAVGPEGYLWAFGNVFDASQANTSASGEDATTPVGAYAPNSYGLYDMSGNASEWVEDWYDEAFYAQPDASRPNPVNRRRGKGRRVQRGGSWWHGIEGVRTTRRYWYDPSKISSLTGFRCARSLPDASRP